MTKVEKEILWIQKRQENVQKRQEKREGGSLGGKGEGHEGMVGSGDNDIDNGWAQELQISSIIEK